MSAVKNWQFVESREKKKEKSQDDNVMMINCYLFLDRRKVSEIDRKIIEKTLSLKFRQNLMTK